MIPKHLLHAALALCIIHAGMQPFSEQLYKAHGTSSVPIDAAGLYSRAVEGRHKAQLLGADNAR